jgi:hypothetical protein
MGECFIFPIENKIYTRVEVYQEQSGGSVQKFTAPIFAAPSNVVL